jgi:hypothetical protein
MPRNLPNSWIFIGLLALTFAGNLFSTPASAEFFGCHDRPGRVLSYDGVSRHQYSSRYTHEFAAQSARTRLGPSRATYAAPRRYWSDRSRW